MVDHLWPCKWRKHLLQNILEWAEMTDRFLNEPFDQFHMCNTMYFCPLYFFQLKFLGKWIDIRIAFFFLEPIVFLFLTDFTASYHKGHSSGYTEIMLNIRTKIWNSTIIFWVTRGFSNLFILSLKMCIQFHLFNAMLNANCLVLWVLLALHFSGKFYIQELV